MAEDNAAQRAEEEADAEGGKGGEVPIAGLICGKIPG